MISAVSYAESNDIAIREYGDGDVLSMGDGAVTLKFWVNTDPSLDMNNQSAQTMVTFGERKILFTADMEQAGQAVLMERVGAEELKADLIKYPHHGKTGLLDEFYQAVRPQLAVITNSYVKWGGIEYLIWKQIPRFYTNPTEKYVHLYTDGNTWVVERVPMGFSESGS
jgi:beta-lactamase superfamily II metal-dependent hydrolase